MAESFENNNVQALTEIDTNIQSQQKKTRFSLIGLKAKKLFPHSIFREKPSNINQKIKHQTRIIDNFHLDQERKATMLKLLEANQDIDQETLNIFIRTVCFFGKYHDLTNSVITGFQEKLLPALEKRDSQVEVFFKRADKKLVGRRMWPTWLEKRNDDSAMKNFTYDCYTREVSSPNITDLLYRIKRIGYKSFGKYEQNRLDALSISRISSHLRADIHDQKDGIHVVIGNIIECIETNNIERLTQLSRDSKDRYIYKDLLEHFDDCKGEVQEVFDGKKQNIKVVDILKRLEINTRIANNDYPITSDTDLNTKMAIFEASSLQERTKLLGDIFDYINSKLITSMERGEIGIEPNIILAMAWVDRKGSDVLRNLSFEDQLGLSRQKWFISILQFYELTSSLRDYNQQEFEEFIDKVSNVNSDEEANRLIIPWASRHIDELSSKYKMAGEDEAYTKTFWSGNIASQLISLIDPKTARTAQGEKMREERLKPDWDKLKGD
jgi:hypothetical protein